MVHTGTMQPDQGKEGNNQAKHTHNGSHVLRIQAGAEKDDRRPQSVLETMARGDTGLHVGRSSSRDLKPFVMCVAACAVTARAMGSDAACTAHKASEAVPPPPAARATARARDAGVGVPGEGPCIVIAASCCQMDQRDPRTRVGGNGIKAADSH